MNNIAETVIDGLCSGCGTCVGICPTEAIHMEKDDQEYRYLPFIDVDICINCKKCVEVCPGRNVNFEKLKQKIFGEQESDKYLGHIINTYVGHSNNINIRHNSSSGGIISNILIYALKNKIIDGALVVKVSEEDPLETVSYIARNEKEIIKASGSKYCPVSINTNLKEIIKREGKYAVVGLPCHIHGIRKAEELIDGLNKKIVLRIGLFCSHMVNFDGVDVLLKKMGIKKDKIKDLRYRGDGWPGSFSVTLEDGSTSSKPLVGSWNSYWPMFSAFFFTPMRCLMCPDEACELADISMGDAWLPEYEQEKIGESIIISRNNFSEELLTDMKNNDEISIKQISSDKVKDSQLKNLIYKKDDFISRLNMLDSLGYKIPEFDNNNVYKKRGRSFLRNLYAYFNVMFSKNGVSKRILRFIPLPLFRFYFGVYKYFLVSKL